MSTRSTRIPPDSRVALSDWDPDDDSIIDGKKSAARERLDADRARSERGAIASLTQQAIELLPALKHAHFIRTWSGTEGYLPDRQPVLCPSRTTPGLVHGFGFAGAGFQIGPAVGEVLAELARDGQTSTPIDAFSLARFDEPPAPIAGATPTTPVQAH